MLKKVVKICMFFITLFCYTSTSAIEEYQYTNSNNKSKVEELIDEVYTVKQQFVDLFGEIDDNSSNNVNFSYNASYWWPIGSVETTTENGVLFASGTPETVYVSSAFGTRIDPISGAVSVHRGTDISGGTYGATNIIAAKDGIVVYPLSTEGNNCPDNRSNPGVCSDYGNYVKIQHSDGNYTVYGHMYANSITVKAGDAVRQGQVIGKMGSSGYSTGPHLHFEIRFGSDSYSSSQPTVNEYIFPDNPRPVSVGVVSGDSNKQTVCLTLKNSGYPDNGVAGIMTNMNYESEFNPINLEGIYEKSLGYTDESYTQAVDNGTYKNFIHDSAGYGLVQWTYWTLKQDLYEYVKDKNASIGDINAQLELLVKQLSEKYPSVDNSLKNVSNTAEDNARTFCLGYENPANASNECSRRVSNASTYANYVKNGCN